MEDYQQTETYYELECHYRTSRLTRRATTGQVSLVYPQILGSGCPRVIGNVSNEEKKAMLCFSYGSNMSIKRIQDRVPSASPVAVAKLAKHQLRFHKISNDGSGKCDVQETEDPNDYVFGVLFEISDSEKPNLDRKEGLGAGYNEKEVEVITTDGRTMKSLIYFATNIDAAMRPYTWYKKHVLMGAKENGLPEGYIAQIESVIADNDPDKSRSERELSIYR